MSCHLIYYEGGVKKMRPINLREEYLPLRNGGEQASILKAVRSGDESRKKNLVQFNYSCLPNDDGSLRGSKRMSTTVAMDIDHVPAEEMQPMKERIISKKQELDLIMLEESARGKGYHLVFKRKPELSQEDNLKWASQLLGVEYDKGAKDITRVFYTTTEKELIYLDDRVFEQTLATPVISSVVEKSLSEIHEISPRATLGRDDKGEGIPVMTSLDKRIRFIAEGVMKEKKLERSDFIDDGGRHNSVKIFLSAATQLLEPQETNAILAELMPEHWNDENIQKLVSDFYAKYTDPSQKLTKVQEEIFLGSRRLRDSSTTLGMTSPLSSRLSEAHGEISGGEPMPQMPSEKKLPKLIRLLTRNTPVQYKAAVAHAVFPPLGTHLKEVSFEYTDYVQHEATLMNCLMAHTGAGKGCIDEPIRHIMADIKRRDEENTRREAEWKKDCQKKGANKDKQVRPEGLVIQEIDPDMTKPALVTRMDEAEGHFVYVKLNEIDLFEQLKGQTGKQHFQLMCLAFDPGAEFGQTRIGTQSVTARPKCRFNWNACTTIQKGRKFFSRVLTDGPISRINFCTIPEMEIGAEQPIYGKYDSAFDEELKPYIDNLVAARGKIDCPQAFKLAKKLQEECAEFARLSQDETYWNLSHRAIVIAWLKACVLYVANGNQWEKSIEEFVRWSLQYDLWCKMQFFGEDIERANQENERTGSRGPQNMLELLPNEFTVDDAKRVRRQQGKDNNGNRCMRMIRTWLNRGYVIQNTEYSFIKSEKYVTKRN
jgi:hypothetical protein